MGCVPAPGCDLPGAGYVGTGSSYANRSITGCVPAPGGGLPGARYVRVCISNVNRSVTGCVPAPGSDQPGPGVGGVGSSYVGHFGLAPPRGPSRRGCPGSGVSPTAPMMIGISFCTPPIPDQINEVGENSPQFPRSRDQLGHLQFPLYYLPRRTVPDSSSNFWSNPTTFVGSPSLPRKENPRSQAPNCSGDVGR